MKVLIIGAAGFVGGHLIDLLSRQPDIEIYGSKLKTERLAEVGSGIVAVDMDILCKDEVSVLIGRICPDYIIHLAALSSVSYSWKEPALTFDLNVIGTINLLEAVRKSQIHPRILLIGSAEEYGNVKPEDLPINENLNVDPQSPYAVSKVSQELVARMYANVYNMEIVMVRAFNHIGPGQSPTFAIPGFAEQIAKIEKGIKEPVISVGNLSVKRDFSDVRDIVKGYWDLVRYGKKGEVYNIGSGKSYSLQLIVDKLISMSSKKIRVEIDQNRFRPADIPELRADISKICEQINWRPEIDIDTTLSDILGYWRMRC
jgi:GDP-4-dehydro-6-deoxy-D-mannose reductase